MSFVENPVPRVRVESSRAEVPFRATREASSSSSPEQSGFTRKRSTNERIFALWVLIKRRREFRQGLLAAYVDLCKAFDSVIWDALWRILGLCVVQPKLIDLMSELYSGTESAVRCGGGGYHL